MKKIYLYFLSIVLSFCLVSKSSAQTNSAPLKILTLGNSITFDDFSNDTRPDGLRISYRYTLYNLLSESGFAFDFVGSEMAGQDLFPDPQNGGFPGITKEQMVTLLQTGYNPRTATQETNGAYLNIFQPDVILLHIGTNGLTTNVDAIEQILNLIDTYRSQSGKTVKLLIAKIINRKVYHSATTQYNTNLAALVTARNHPDNYIVDMENGAGIDYANDMIDNLHPNATGYSKMAQLWFNTLVNIYGTPASCPKALGGYWNFDINNAGSFTDVISGFNATAITEPIVTAGKISNAVQFSGNSRINITNGTSFNKSGSESFTLQFWIKKGTPCTGTEVIIGRDDPASPLHWWAGIDCSSGNEGKIKFYFTSATGENFSLLSTSNVSDDIWHLITLSRNGADGKTSLYVDQSLQSSGTFKINGSFSAAIPVNIGWLDLSPYYYFTGILDELSLYNVPLAISEIGAIYQEGMNGKNYCNADFLITPSNLQASLSINNAVLTWNDNSSNESGYKIERKTENGSFVMIEQLSANTNIYVDKSLPANTVFTYRVSAFRSTGVSGYSNESLLTTSGTTVITNVAAGKPSSQSSTGYGGTSDRGNDDNTNGDWSGNSITHTNTELNPWWQVDLQASYAIDRIEIWNRMNSCCIGRMVNFYVFISDVPFVSVDLNTTINQQGVWSNFNAAYPNPSLSVSVNRTGRYIRLQLAGQATINLAELKVFGSPTAPPQGNVPSAPLSFTATASSETSISLNWTDQSSDETGFRIERKTGNEGFSLLSEVPANTTAYVDLNVLASTNYTYRIFAFNTYGNSAYSNESSATTQQQAPLTNLAIGKPSVQSSTIYGGTASRGNDDNTNGDWFANSVTHTNDEMAPWWQVDLQNTYLIDHIRIWNRTNSCCISRMSNYYVFISNNPFTSNDPNVLSNQQGVWSIYNTTYPNPDIQIPVHISGRYVRIQLASQGAINLAEMEIFGSQDTPSEPTIPLTPSSLLATTGAIPQVVLTWIDQSNNENGFHIERKTGNGDFVLLTTLTANVQTYTDNTVQVLESYTYRISAYNNAGNSSFSNESAVTIPDPVIITNLALQKPSSQSSTIYGGTASRANDGNRNGDWFANSVTHTNDEMAPWWQVDLQNTYLIDHIRIWNRTNSCCISRMSNYYVFISNNPFTSNDPNVLSNQQGVWSIYNTTYPNPDIQIPVHISGRYVRIQLASQGAINLAEMEIFGSQDTPSEPTIPLTPSSLLATTGAIPQVVLTWIDQSNNENGFHIERKTGNGDFVLLTTLTANVQTYTDNTVQVLESYTYRISAYNNAGNSSFSNESAVTIPDPVIITNLALQKPSSQSSTIYGGTASRANDGNTNGDWYANSVTHTNDEMAPWWQVDLQDVYLIDHIEVWNRTNSCCRERLTNYYVFVSDQPFSTFNLSTTLNQQGVSNYYNSAFPNPSSSIAVNRTGRFVRLQLSGQGVINLAELQVFGNASGNVQLAGPDSKKVTIALGTDDRMGFSVYPVPFSDLLHIQFNLQAETKGSLLVYNIFGQEVSRIFEGVFPEGFNSFEWNGSSLDGKAATGIYLIKLQAGPESFYKKVILTE